MAKRKKKDTATVEATATTEQPVAAAVVAAPEPLLAEVVPAVQQPVAAQPIISQEESQPQPSFAEREQPKSKYPDPNKPFALAHNNVAGVRLLKHDRFKQTQLQFTDKVSPELHSQLREGGWTYRPEEQVYTKQYGSRGEPLAILEAKRLYNRLVEQLTPETSQGRSF